MNKYLLYRLVTRVLVILLLGIILIIERTNAQPRRSGMAITNGRIYGYLINSNNQKPIEYANIVVFNMSTGDQVDGTISDQNGYFNFSGLRIGQYFLEIQFIGFKANVIDSLIIRPRQPDIDLGRINITPNVLQMEDVEVVGEKPEIEFQIDKKVINVSQQITSLSGTAVDVLENIPSVSVDLEGNVSLRGSGSFNLLIDGRPSVFDPSDALQMIPASTIENIEIVTNPSARYDPDGVAGLINIITKEQKVSGISGMLNANGGTFGNYGTNLLMNYQKNGTNYFIGANLGRRSRPGNLTMRKHTSFSDTISYNNTDGNSSRGGNSVSLRGGVDMKLTSADQIRAIVSYGDRTGGRNSDMDYTLWSNPGNDTLYCTSENSSDRGGDFFSINLDYNHKFKKANHQLIGKMNFSRRDSEDESSSLELDEFGAIKFGQRSTEDGPGTRLRVNLDYTLPIRKEDRFELGYQLRNSSTRDDNTMHIWDEISETYLPQDEFFSSTDYQNDIQSGYMIYAGQLDKLGYQVGLRSEFINRKITMSGESNSFLLDRWDYYPTFHASYQLENQQQVMASYTRRIDRIRGWHLEPFISWMDSYNVRRGNPDLKPEYIDSYEAGYQKRFGKSLFSFETYYRITNNKIERVRSIYAKEIILNTFENVGTDYAFGTELMLTLLPYKWWNMNLMGNIYDYRVKGVLYGEPFEEGSFNWSIRLNNTFKLGKSTRVQFSAIYRSPSASAQGSNGSMFFTNLALKQSFMDNKISTTLQIRDLFGTASHSHENEGPDFYSYTKFERQARMVSVTVSYNINNYETDRERDGRNNGESDFDDEGGYD